MKYIVWLYVLAAIVLSIIFCLKLRMLNLTGIYDAKVHIYYNINDSLAVDTVFNSLVIVNYDYDCDYCFLVKWTFDDFLVFGQKEFNIPNVLNIELSPTFRHACSNFSLSRNQESIKDFNALIKRSKLLLSFYLAKKRLRVEINGFRKS